VHVIAESPGASEFERFFREEHPKLVALGLAWTGDRDTARELAQETMTRAFRSWERLRDFELPGAWVRRVMLNLLIDRKRHEQRQLRVIDRLSTPTEAPPPELINGAWWTAVRALPDQQRAAVTLHYLEDLSIAQVAEVLNMAPGTVKSTLSRAREKLRIALGEGERS
jgi:RNA polymerase sigma-70 factor (ECF subfamily)